MLLWRDSLFFLGCFDCGLVVSRGFPFFKGDCVHRTGRKTIPQTVAVVLVYQFCFPVYHFDSSLVTGFGAKATTIAERFVDFDDFSDHNDPPSFDFAKVNDWYAVFRQMGLVLPTTA